MTIILGTNRLVDCQTILLVGGQPLLRVEENPLRLTVVTPPTLPSGRHVRVVQNAVEPPAAGESHVRVVSTERTVQLFWDSILFASVAALESGEINAHIDFRVLGLNMYDDMTGLHLGGLHMAQSSVAGAPAAFSFG